MDLKAFREQREQRLSQQKKFRTLCLACFQPEFSCYCAQISSFDPKIKFMILIHPIEVKRRIATGRMSHLCLQNSQLIQGEEFDKNKEVDLVLNNSSIHSVILYPGRRATNLSGLEVSERKELIPSNKQLAVFVIDGTWTTAKKMLHRSPNLHSLPQVCFSPPKPSTFRVRKQPAPGCVSTIEAIHETIELLGPTQGYDTRMRAHDNLLQVFDSFVEQQLDSIAKHQNSRHGLSFRRNRSA